MSKIRRQFEGFEFDLVEEIHPVSDSAGRLLEYEYRLPLGMPANRYAAGPFCRFQIAGPLLDPGVYAIIAEDQLKYIGECSSLSARFGPNGYGRITPRNCHSDGQATNCKVNSLILASAKAAKTITLWFHATASYKEVEAALIKKLRPPWNGKTGLAVRPTPPSGGKEHRRELVHLERASGATAEAFRQALEEQFATATKREGRWVRIRAGDLHKTVGDYPGKNQRMPTCCRVMKSAMLSTDRLIESPPKGAGASLTIEYKLPRGPEN
jgi:hypothetical protein